MPFGCFHDDEAGLPAFHYEAAATEPYFILGNHRLTVFAGVGGRMQWLTGERTWMRMNHHEGFAGAHEAELQVDGRRHLLMADHVAGPDFARRVFGCGHVIYETLSEGVRCLRTFAVEPDKTLADAVPGVLARVTITNESGKGRHISYAESLRATPRMLAHQWLGADKRLPIIYHPRIGPSAPDALRIDFEAVLDDPHVACEPNRPAMLDGFPPSLAVTARDAGVAFIDGWVRITRTVALPPGASVVICWIAAIAFPGDLETLDARMAAMFEESGQIPFQSAWAARLPTFPEEENPVLRREMTWHAHTLEAMATHSAFSGETFIPQGTNYDYSHAFIAAPRDHMQHLLGVVHYHPELAKSALRHVLQKVDAKGDIVYTGFAAGMTTNGIWHTSDQQLYLFLAINEYLRITGDHGFLAETVRVHPGELGHERTVFGQVERAFGFLRDEVGLGLGGLPRILNSDWNDGIFYNRPLRYGEFLVASSHANAAMAAALLEPLARHLETGCPPPIAPPHRDALLASIRRYRKSVTDALLADMEGRSFSRRAYLGDGSTLGEDNIFLEPQPWLLMVPEFDRKHELWETLRTRLCAEEPLGSRCSEFPITGHGEAPAGEAENAAFWYALHGQLITALIPLDPAAASDLLRRMSPSHFASTYPDIWYGHWSGSDTCNSSLADRPGRMTSLDPLREVTPIPCAHAHAWSLYTYQLMREPPLSEAHSP